MVLSELTPDPEEKSSAENTDRDGTAPDSDTQSSAASEDGDRTADGGSRAPSDPAEGA